MPGFARAEPLARNSATSAAATGTACRNITAKYTGRMRRLLFVLVFAASCGEDATSTEPEVPLPPRDGGGIADDSGGGNDAGSDAPAEAGFTIVERDINHILSTGQSLSVGAGGNPPLTTKQPYDNITFASGVMSEPAGLTSFIPLVEGDMLGANAVETMSSGLANLVTKTTRDVAGGRSHDLLVSVHGVGGTAYAGLKKGTQAYANGMAQAKAGMDLATAAQKTYVVRAVTTVHGESDHLANNTSYAANLLEWQKDYETDVKALTGQSEPVPMFQTQISAWTILQNATTSATPGMQLAAHVNAPGKVILVGAKYHLPYSDGLHLTNEGYRHLGEDHAKAYRRVILEGQTWEPVRPKSITRNGAVVTVEMHVPSPPLVLDTTRVTNPGNFGFEWKDDSLTPKIQKVEVTGPTTVVVTLTAAPTGANKRLRYAFTGTAGAPGGPTTGPRGNLRDSDATPSPSGYDLFNWCIHFDEPVQ
jgi:hypothetical protein